MEVYRRNRKFADSSLEEAGSEPSVPRDTTNELGAHELGSGRGRIRGRASESQVRIGLARWRKPDSNRRYRVT